MDKIKEILESGLLECYLMGDCTEEESLRMQQYIHIYPEIKIAYDEYQEAINKMAEENASLPPAHLKSNLLKEINSANPRSSLEPNTNPQMPSGINKLLLALSVLGLLSACWFFWNGKNKLDKLQEKYTILQENCNQSDKNYAAIKKELEIIKAPDTRALWLDGKAFNQNAQLVAYWNPQYEYALLDLKTLPKLKTDQCYQIWADKDGKMISRGTFQLTEDFVKIEYLDNAESLNVTIEPIGGSHEPTIANLVAQGLFT